jgi:hypothetical protein
MIPQNLATLSKISTMSVLAATMSLHLQQPALADYLELSGNPDTSLPKTHVALSWNGYDSSQTFIVKYKKSSQLLWKEKDKVTKSDPSLAIGNGGTWIYRIGGLECNTKYDFKVRMKGRGWRDVSVKTQGCGSTACPHGGEFDSANCYLGAAPTGTTAFIHNNRYYYTPLNGNSCPFPGSSFDGANCFVKSVAPSTQPFTYGNGWYYAAYP